MRRASILQLLLVLCALHVPANATPRQIRLTLQLPPGSHLYNNLQQFKDKVAGETRGELEIELFPSSQLYKAHEVPTAVGSGAIEMGVSLLAQYVDIVPATDVFAIPFLFSDPDMFEAAASSQSAVRAPLDNSILAATGARVLWWVPNGAEAIGSRGPALRTPAHMAGKKVRVAGATLAEFVKQCGGIPVIMPGSEQYAVLKRGEVDAVSTSIESLESRKLWEIANNVALIHHARQAFVVLINERVWQSLTEAQRSVLRKFALEAERLAQMEDAALDRETIALLANHGVKVEEATAQELEDWKECSSPVSEVFLAKSGTTGAKVMAAYRQLVINFARSRTPKISKTTRTAPQ